ncbi:AsnC family transcriptional regulator [Streptomyces spinoverrucosus]|uniref:Lrp/AsnC family transcriptional regulator n=1 Tax=Streptomyces spinoverrucosus TaxID=284043 RepID=UPI0018C3636D|nr:AsnC family transcriptional regulator [Streptomyces spinoverrucosus]MBG0850496.1 AsnC family transcriptional regulator [Streptomyces spinoverrucosus]
MQDQELSELDLAIVNALQIQPRAPWSLVGRVLGVDAVTVARRWKRLSDSGAAWVSGHMAPGTDDRVMAQVEIVTAAAQTGRVAEILARDISTLSVKQTSGARDILAIVWAYSLDELADYIGERIARCPGVRATRSHVVTDAPYEGSRWRLRSLSAEQRAQLRPPERPPVPAEPLRPLDRRIVVALGEDGRMPLSELAERAGTSVATARRRLSQLLGSGGLVLRCSLARPLTGWPVTAVYFASVPAEHLQAAEAALRTLPELRLCTVTAGPHNLILDAWLRGVHDVHRLEAHLEHEMAHLGFRVGDRAVVLRTDKNVGRILDRRGHSVAAVPLERLA